MSDNHEGYIDFFELLGVKEDAKPGEVRRIYRRRMKELVSEIARVEITPDRRARYLLEMAQLNAGLCVLRDTEAREAYAAARAELIDLEERWRAAAETGSPECDALRRRFDSRVKDFLSKYCEEIMLSAGLDKECVEACNWDAAHERHASRILRFYRQKLYQKILERLPYAEVTTPRISWDERRRAVAAIINARK